MKLVAYRGVPIRLSADFSEETLQARRDWQEVLKVMKSKDLQSRLFYPAKECQEYHRKWRSQRTYMHDPWT